MSNFKYAGYQYNLTSAYEFLKEFCLRNNQVADQKNLNRPLIQLKRELNTLIGQIKILTSESSIIWDPSVVYEAGEIVSYFSVTKPEYTKEEIQDSYYLALPNDYQNLSIRPPENSNFWKKITIQEMYPSLYLENYALKNKEKEDWFDSSNELSVLNLKNLKLKLKEFKSELDTYYKEIFLTPGNTNPYKVIEPTQPAHKEYVDKAIETVVAEQANIDEKLKDYVQIQGPSRVLTTTSSGSVESFSTPKNGLLPGADSSCLGSSNKKFSKVYAKMFEGTATKALYADIAEIIETDLKFEAGDILSLDIDTGDFKLFQPHDEIFGVVSSKPGFILNSDAEGVMIAHKGQVPVKVKGPVKKGQIIIADGGGVAIARDKIIFEERPLKIGIALETNTKKSVKLIKVFI